MTSQTYVAFRLITPWYEHFDKEGRVIPLEKNPYTNEDMRGRGEAVHHWRSVDNLITYLTDALNRSRPVTEILRIEFTLVSTPPKPQSYQTLFHGDFNFRDPDSIGEFVVNSTTQTLEPATDVEKREYFRQLIKDLEKLRNSGDLVGQVQQRAVKPI